MLCPKQPPTKPDLFQVTSKKVQKCFSVETTIFCQQQCRDELTNLKASVNDADQITGDVEPPLQLRDGALHVAAGQGFGKVGEGQGGEEHLRWGAERRAGRSQLTMYKNNI